MTTLEEIRPFAVVDGVPCVSMLLTPHENALLSHISSV